jgi:6-phosphofructokinase 1
VAEGAIDRDLNKIPCSAIKDLLSNELKLDTRVTTLGHVQRGGAPCFYDRMLSTLQGVEAVNAVLAATPTSESRVIAIIENKIVQQSLKEAVALTLQVPEAIKARDFDLAMKLRDSEFTEYYKSYKITTALEQPELRLPEDKARNGTIARALLTSVATQNWHYPRWSSMRWNELRDQSRGGVLHDERPQAHRSVQRL